MLRVLLLAVLILAVVQGVRAFRRLEPDQRRRSIRYGVYAIVAAFALLLLTRAGLHWLGVIGAGAWAVVRAIMPLALRLLPLAARLGGGRVRGESEPGARGSQTNAGASSAQAHGHRMTRDEALEVLGLRDGATREEILSAYRQLIRKVHPDVPGGSTYLAGKLNQAKDVLLG